MKLSSQLLEFLDTAKGQATEKLRVGADEKVAEQRARATNERDKSLKSLEAYLSSDPLPVIESVTQVSLVEGIYEARSKYECEGGVKYDFGLAANNSKMFHQELTLSQLGHELKIPVRYSRAILKKERVPGFERLDQYVLAGAEASNGRIHATFVRAGNGSTMKVVTSGPGQDDFVGIEFNSESEKANVMNDPALAAHVDLKAVRKAMSDLISGLGDLGGKKVALLRLEVDGKESLGDPDYQKLIGVVFDVLGPRFREVLAKAPGSQSSAAGENVTLPFVRERLKVLGALSGPASKALGVS